MTMLRASPPRPGARAGAIGVATRRLLLAGLLGLVAALLASCGSSGAGLIPTANATPLQGDFEEVAQAAKNGNGSCTATDAAIAKTERDFSELPATLDAGLHKRLHEGISKLRDDAHALCVQPFPQTTVTTTSPRTTTSTPTTTTTPAVTQPTTTPTTPATTTPTTAGPGGGTPAGEEAAAAGKGSGSGGERGNSGGAEPNGGGESEKGKEK